VKCEITEKAWRDEMVITRFGLVVKLRNENAWPCSWVGFYMPPRTVRNGRYVPLVFQTAGLRDGLMWPKGIRRVDVLN
jgi:hypothetical protein